MKQRKKERQKDLKILNQNYEQRRTKQRKKEKKNLN